MRICIWKWDENFAFPASLAATCREFGTGDAASHFTAGYRSSAFHKWQKMWWRAHEGSAQKNSNNNKKLKINYACFVLCKQLMLVDLLMYVWERPRTQWFDTTYTALEEMNIVSLCPIWLKRISYGVIFLQIDHSFLRTFACNIRYKSWSTEVRYCWVHPNSPWLIVIIAHCRLLWTSSKDALWHSNLFRNFIHKRPHHST